MAQSPYSQTATDEEAIAVVGVAEGEEVVDHIMERAEEEEVDETEDTTQGGAAEVLQPPQFDNFS